MIPPIDMGTLSPPAQKIAQPSAPPKLQDMAARGVAPGLKPGELTTVLVLLAASERDSVRETATKTLAALPDPILTGALGSDLPPAVVDHLARAYTARPPVLEKLLAMPRIDVETLLHLATTGDEATTELIAVNEERLLKNPRVIEKLYLNKHTRMSTADRLIDLATRNSVELTGIPAWREASTAIKDELIPEPSPEPTPDDMLFQETDAIAEELTDAATTDTHLEDDEGQEKVLEKFLPLYKRLADMTISQRIRRAMLGTREERMLLVRDNNRLVASAAVRSPQMQEDDIALISRNRNISDEVLRVIASTAEWMHSYTIKKSLVENPRTPVMVATKLVPLLRESDLKSISKSKNVTSPVKDAARRHLDRRK
ncbi:hypothetical protein [Chondromyces apiculatus]|uniref:Uncharacterized protein n=1 Tax=Chondromyces apiculatus DSM 436 TaxID=1192034 RepID=A0A017TG54_9BACT|nr:hypothetical protein [Chondromyces apiculatus]EYF07810.1 Hypothetical protein CAP_6832 [Chondromyces apiculatus DSM 436]